MPKRISAVVVSTCLIVTGCSTTGPKQNAGATMGAVVGGVLGAQLGNNGNTRLAGALAGAFAGAVVGGAIGAQLDAQDKKRLAEITMASIRTGGKRSFRSKSGARVSTSVVATATVSGRTCRTVQQDVVLPNGKLSSDTVRGCKGKDGWSV